MFVVVKRATILVAILVVAVMVLLSLGTVWQQRAEAQPLCIAIDAGHGGYDGGVTGLTYGVKESDVNLSVALYLATYLRNAGYRTVLTRTRDQSPVEATVSGKDRAVGAKKVRDMDLRLQTVRQSSCAVLVSVHCNFYPSSYRRGIQVFYHKSSDEQLAQCLQAVCNQTLNRQEIGRDFSPLWGDYYLLAKAPCPSAIVECGFLSNAQDEALLCDANYRMTLAYRLCQAIEDYLHASDHLSA